MCLAVIAIDAHPRYAVVIAANRDEFHARAARPAHWWRNAGGAPILAGRDLEQGGTWLGVTRRGRWGFVTNVREPGRRDPRAPSRGALVPTLLRERRAPLDAVATAVANALGYNGFNLVGGEGLRAAFGSNRGSRAVQLHAGIHGVSNAQLDTPWPKLVRAKAGLATWTAGASDDLDPLWAVLGDRTLARDDELPDTGLTRERERMLSSPFIVGDDYGTRCSTLLALARDGEAQFVERSFDAGGAVTGEVAFRFDLRPPKPLQRSARPITRCAMPASSNTPPEATKPRRA
jgi:uncharacterized protein with NRDE domain